MGPQKVVQKYDFILNYITHHLNYLFNLILIVRENNCDNLPLPNAIRKYLSKSADSGYESNAEICL